MGLAGPKLWLIKGRNEWKHLKNQAEEKEIEMKLRLFGSEEIKKA